MEYALELCLIAALALACLLYHFGTKNHGYWQELGVPGPAPLPFLGSLHSFILSTEPLPDIVRRIYKDYDGEPFVGLLSAWRPALLVRDPALVKTMFTKDFEYLPDRAFSFDEVQDPLSANLINLDGVRWQQLRNKLSPTFSSGKVKNMVPLMLDSCRELQCVLEGPASRGETLDMRDVLGRFSTDIIGSCAFGINCNALKDPDAEFHKYGKLIFEPNWRNKLSRTVMMTFPNVPFLHKLINNKSLTQFFVDLVRNTITYREKTGVKRNDFIDLLVEIKQTGRIVDNKDVIEDPFLKVPISTSSEELRFTDTLMTAQAFVFFAAGFETSSTTMSFCLAELAQNQDIQKKLHHELDRVLKVHGYFTYEALSAMPYLDKVISETLRKHPAIPMVPRRVLKPYKIPESEVVLPPGMLVMVPVAGMHADPAYYPEPDRFDPDRFNAEAIAARPPYSYLPFGEGPRICIGMRFALLLTKLGVATVMSRYRVEPSNLSSYPIQYAKGTLVTVSKDGCHITLKNR